MESIISETQLSEACFYLDSVRYKAKRRHAAHFLSQLQDRVTPRQLNLLLIETIREASTWAKTATDQSRMTQLHLEKQNNSLSLELQK